MPLEDPKKQIQDLKSFRASMQLNPNQINKTRSSAINSINRLSNRFGGGGVDAGQLVIENERLKTTIEILQQKLQTISVTEDQTKQLAEKEKKYLEEIEDLRIKVSSLESELTVKVSGYEQKLAA